MYWNMNNQLGWEPFRQLERLQHELTKRSQAMNETACVTKEQEKSRWTFLPAADVYEKDSGYLVRLELPGVRKEDLELKVEKGRLSLRAEPSGEDIAEGYRQVRKEYEVGAYERTFTLPDDVFAADIRARLQNGVLYLELPRREEAQPRSIDIEVEG